MHARLKAHRPHALCHAHACAPEQCAEQGEGELRTQKESWREVLQCACMHEIKQLSICGKGPLVLTVHLLS